MASQPSTSHHRYSRRLLASMDMPLTRLLPNSCYAEASALFAANASLPLEERNELVMKFLEEKEKEQEAGTFTEVLGDMSQEKDGGICKLECGSDELVQGSVKGEVRSCIKNYVTSEALAEMAARIEEEIKERPLLNNASGILIGDLYCENEKAGGMVKRQHLPRNKRGPFSVEGELECKKGRMAESSLDMGEAALLEGVSTVDA